MGYQDKKIWASSFFFYYIYIKMRSRFKSEASIFCVVEAWIALSISKYNMYFMFCR